jgi:hypothetical protein
MTTSGSICLNCGAEMDSKLRGCAACAARRKRLTIAGSIGGGVALAIVILVTMTRSDDDEADAKASAKTAEQAPVAPPSAPIDRDAPSPAETAAIADCDAANLGRTVEEYNRENAYRATVRAVNAYQAKCPRASHVDWDLLYALEQLKRWKEAEAVSDRLLKEDPSDTDFWWWRGKDRRYMGAHERAVADLRQSLAGATASSNGIQIDYLDASSKELKRRCETAFALRWLATKGVELRDSAQREFNEVYIGEDCVKIDGRGEVTWSASGMKRTKLKGTIGSNNKPIVVMIDPGLGTTLVRAQIADERKLARGEQVDLLLPTGLGTGIATSADLAVGGASARDVPMAIVDKLPDGVDVVAGLSFAWRFDVQLSVDGDRYIAKTPKQE